MVYRDISDPEHAVYLCRFSLASGDGFNPDADYHLHMKNLGRAVQEAIDHADRLAAVIVHDRGYPPPHATLRSELAEWSAQAHFDPICAFVTPNIVVRGVLTALNWIRQPTHEEKVFAQPGDALAWLQERRKRPLGQVEARLLTLVG